MQGGPVAIDGELVKAAAERLASGGIVAFPTETVYGLGGDATSGLAVARIYELKGRPRFNPLIVHLAEVVAALRLGVRDRRAERLAERFWPGPLTIVVERAPESGLSELVSAGLSSVALRVPSHPVARQLLTLVGRPIAAPSANRSGRISPTTAAHVRAEFGDRVDIVLDAGASTIGLESTVVSLIGGAARILRPGAVTQAEIEAVLGERVEVGGGAAADTLPIAPGQLASHYAPRARVLLDCLEAGAGSAFLGFGDVSGGGAAVGGPRCNLSPRGDLEEAAANLYAMLRELDATGVDAIAVAPVPEVGLGVAINERLRRAAAPRPRGDD
ncbi:MAG: threonylcarbamoyl-AMP synthase [Rhizobiales bacterium]|nr:threonylcarbamoyl-AMP synthase [Hyphomicrobiales bacterium]